MPLYYYIASKPVRCPLCRDGFEQWQPASEGIKINCPRCGGLLERKEAPVFLPKAAREPGTNEAKSAGFKVYKRNLHGLYEKQ